GAAAVSRPNQHVLIVGGEVAGRASNTMEVYDPATASFSQVSEFLSVARSGHAAVSISGGRILVAGGFGPDGEALDSTDIYDSADGHVTAGSPMAMARANFSATRLLNDTILIAGGTNGKADLASAEIFDPETGE